MPGERGETLNSQETSNTKTPKLYGVYFMKTTFEVKEATPLRPIQAEDDDHPDILNPKRTVYDCGVVGIEYLRRADYSHIQKDTLAQDRLTEFMDEYFKAPEMRQSGYDIIEPPDSQSDETPLRRIGKAALRHFHFDRVLLVDPAKITQDGNLDFAVTHLESANVPYPEGKIGLALVDYSEKARREFTQSETLAKVMSNFVVPVAYVQSELQAGNVVAAEAAKFAVV
jgi:hypothetical protein